MHSTRRVAIWVAAMLAAAGPAPAQPPEVDDAVCISCHAEPSTRFHAQPSHKKIACASCHGNGAQHVAEVRVRPTLAVDAVLCASCHPARKPRPR